MKKIIFATIISLFCVSAFAYNEGDKVVLKDNASKYCTGQKVPGYFKGKTFTVQQVGCKKYPKGVLLKEIYSWVDEKFIETPNVEEAKNTINVASSGVDEQKNQYVVVSDTIFFNKVDTFYMNNGAAVDTMFNKQHQVYVVFDTVYIDGSKQALTSKDTLFLVQETSTETAKGVESVAVADTVVATADTVVAVQDTVAAAVEDSAYNKHFDRVAVGVRGGMAANMPFSNQFKWDLGYGAFLDVQYAHYFKRSNETKPYCGIMTGISAGYVSNGFEGSINDSYTTQDAKGAYIDYNITAENIKQNVGEVQIQVPLMFALVYKGLFFNVGPRFVLPVYSHYTQSMENPHITATYQKEGVSVRDEKITGRVTEDQLSTKGAFDNARFKLYASFEIGYEFKLKNQDCIALGVYADYSVFRANKSSVQGNSMIYVSQIGEDPKNPCPTVTVQPAINCYANRFAAFDAGLKLVYIFNFLQK